MFAGATCMDDEGLLLIEFNHRLFNTLQVIEGYLFACSRCTSLRDMHQKLRELEDRLQALAGLHALLARTHDGCLEDHCRTIVGLLLRSFDREEVVASVRMQDLPLDRGQRLRVVLLVVELLTNVLKHSLLEDYGGTVWIDLRSCKGWVELSVSDSRKGPAFCGAPSRIVSALAQGLSGEAQVVDLDGYTACVRFPLAPHDHADMLIPQPRSIEQPGG